MAPIKKAIQGALSALRGPRAEALDTAYKNGIEMLGLPEGHTPHDRARKMGFDVDNPWYHGTDADFDEFKVSRRDVGIHMGTPGQANDRLGYKAMMRGGQEVLPGQNVMPVVTSARRPLRMRDSGSWDHDNLEYALRDAGIEPDKVRRSQTLAQDRDLIRGEGHDSIIYSNDGEVEGQLPLIREEQRLFKLAQDAMGDRRTGSFHPDKMDHPAYLEWNDAYKRMKAYSEDPANQKDSLIVLDPKNIRSVNAAFDPAKRNSKNILAGGAGATVGAAAYQDAEPEGHAGGGLIKRLAGALSTVDRVIPGKPSSVKIPGEGTVAALPIKELEDAADSYMRQRAMGGKQWTPEKGTVQGDNPGYAEVLADVKKVDADFAKDRDMYVGPGGAGQIRTRYPDFAKWHADNPDTPVIMPRAGLTDPPYSQFSFGNGRHRFANMRDNGIEAVPMTVNIEDADRFRDRYGWRSPAHIERFPDFDEERAKRIAAAFEEMQHDPTNPAVKRAYDAMIDETMDQYRALKDAGIDYKFLKPGEADPYAASPAMGYADLIKNGKLHVFPTEQGYGTLNAADANNPLLKRVGRVGDLDNATANDAFRAVHDSFGHFAPGNPFFRHKGEERAWYAHSKMYSDDALPAMTSETRGQNSWMNFGPHAEHNRTASGADSVFADQKAGLLPEWAYKGYAQGGFVKPFRQSTNVDDRRPVDDPTRSAPMPAEQDGAVERWLRRNASWLWDDGQAHAGSGELSSPRDAIPNYARTVPTEPDISQRLYDPSAPEPMPYLTPRQDHEERLRRHRMQTKNFAVGGYVTPDDMRGEDLVEEASWIKLLNKGDRLTGWADALRKELPNAQKGSEASRLLKKEERDLWTDGIGINRNNQLFEELDDSGAKLRYLPDPGPVQRPHEPVQEYLARKNAWVTEGGQPLPSNQVLSDVLQHDELFDIYPDLKKLPLSWRGLGRQGWDDDAHKGSMLSVGNQPIRMAINPRGGFKSELLSTILHENQHAIQAKEGWTGGSNHDVGRALAGRAEQEVADLLNVEIMAGMMEKGMTDADILRHKAFGHLPAEQVERMLMRTTGSADEIGQRANRAMKLKRDAYPDYHAAYELNAGETDARNVQRRMYFDAEDRKNSFWKDTEDRQGQMRSTSHEYGAGLHDE